MTVSRILSGKGHLYRPETREKVLAEARRQQYRPNSFAKAIRARQFGTVALIAASDMEFGWISPGLQNGILAELNKNDTHLIINYLPLSRVTPGRPLPRLLREWSVDGLLLNHMSALTPEITALIREGGLPAIRCNVREDTDAVYPDDFGGAVAAVEILRKAGHKRIGYFTLHPPFAHFSYIDRYDGYVRAMTESGLTPQLFRAELKLSLAEQELAATEWLKRAGRPTAVVTPLSGDVSSVFAAAAKLGLRVPEDLSIITFDEDRLDHGHGRFDYMALPTEELGREAVRMLQEKIEQSNKLLPARCLPCTYRCGLSVGPPPITKRFNRRKLS